MAKSHERNIVLVAMHKSVAQVGTVLAIKEFESERAAIKWANEQTCRWIANMRSAAKASGGNFIVDGGYINYEEIEAGGVLDFFSSIKDEMFFMANDSEEMFFIGVDEATLLG